MQELLWNLKKPVATEGWAFSPRSPPFIPGGWAGGKRKHQRPWEPPFRGKRNTESGQSLPCQGRRQAPGTGRVSRSIGAPLLLPADPKLCEKAPSPQQQHPSPPTPFSAPGPEESSLARLPGALLVRSGLPPTETRSPSRTAPGSLTQLPGRRPAAPRGRRLQAGPAGAPAAWDGRFAARGRRGARRSPSPADRQRPGLSESEKISGKGRDLSESEKIPPVRAAIAFLARRAAPRRLPQSAPGWQRRPIPAAPLSTRLKPLQTAEERV